jgi:hypothetical protein
MRRARTQYALRRAFAALLLLALPALAADPEEEGDLERLRHAIEASPRGRSTSAKSADC